MTAVLTTPEVDVLIIGAGLSGIGAARHLGHDLPACQGDGHTNHDSRLEDVGPERGATRALIPDRRRTKPGGLPCS